MSILIPRIDGVGSDLPRLPDIILGLKKPLEKLIDEIRIRKKSRFLVSVMVSNNQFIPIKDKFNEGQK
ncbi:hypothetical protein BpHYR1_027666 [Brachionus plicatilis]|uniref:Uncharacterized protein n=1 Tax=Brachionus plicatilis TaxID=10195 RepID=A0A3M7QV43_BRAPC|nr:hypothetical protein BpHYR1_027666 [Brachionus plicatilis]